MINKDEETYSKYLEGVRPLKKKNKIEKKIKQIPKNLIKKTNKIEKKESEKQTKTKKTKSKYLIQSNNTNKKLRRGKIQVDKKIDFHGLTVFDAEEMFSESVLQNYYKKKRCLLFVTGKGLNINYQGDNEKDLKNPKLYYGKIRSAFLEWVKKPQLAKFILTIERANQEHGGDGAFYVYLRKNKN
tara:strand:- start:81 stop:635 length:555 start_codon:yes stop_codon:yes gene_type:complete